MKANFNRRAFLGRLLWGAGAAALPLGWSNLVRGKLASDAPSLGGHCFVFAYFEGGWDLLLGPDPRHPADFPDAAAPETGIQPAYSLIGPAFPQTPVQAAGYMLGPCAGAFTEVSQHFSVLRGINMGTLTHEVGRRHFLTGRPPSGLQARGPSVGSLAVAQMAPDCPVPHVVNNAETYNEGLPAFAAGLTVTNVEQMRFVLQANLGMGAPGVTTAIRKALADYESSQVGQAEFTGAAQTAAADAWWENRERARVLVASGLHAQFDFSSPALAAVRERYGLQAGQLETPGGRAALAAQALKSGLSRVVTVALSTNLDTHDQSWSFNHPTLLRNGFNALAALVKDLASSEAPGGGSWLDRTTIVVFSEFGRTPRLNSRGGRDHHIGNCAFLGGAGIQGGQVFGGSSDRGMEPERVDLATGKVSATGEMLRPEHALATALVAGGLDPSSLRVDALQPLLAPGRRT